MFLKYDVAVVEAHYRYRLGVGATARPAWQSDCREHLQAATQIHEANPGVCENWL